MTREEMRGELRSALRDPAGIEMGSGALDRLLNEGMKDTVLKTAVTRGRWVRNTVAGAELYALPDPAVRVLAVSYKTYPLTYTPDTHINIRNNKARGIPSRFFLLTRAIGLSLIPNAAEEWTLDAVRFPDPMTQDGVECPLPAEMHQLPVMFGIYRASFNYEPAMSENYWNRYLSEVKRVLADMLPVQLGPPAKISDVTSPGGRQPWLYDDIAGVSG